MVVSCWSASKDTFQGMRTEVGRAQLLLVGHVLAEVVGVHAGRRGYQPRFLLAQHQDLLVDLPNAQLGGERINGCRGEGGRVDPCAALRHQRYVVVGESQRNAVLVGGGRASCPDRGITRRDTSATGRTAIRASPTHPHEVTSLVRPAPWTLDAQRGFSEGPQARLTVVSPRAISRIPSP
jgi:hypothetical protein